MSSILVTSNGRLQVQNDGIRVGGSGEDCCCEPDPCDVPGGCDPPPPPYPPPDNCDDPFLVYATLTGFSLNSGCVDSYSCENTPTPVNVVSDKIQILDGFGGGAPLLLNGVWLVNSNADWPRKIGPNPKRYYNWRIGSNECDPNFGLVFTLGGALWVEFQCLGSQQQVRALIRDLPGGMNPCFASDNGKIYDSGWVNYIAAPDTRVTVAVPNLYGVPNTAFTPGLITLNFCAQEC